MFSYLMKLKQVCSINDPKYKLREVGVQSSPLVWMGLSVRIQRVPVWLFWGVSVCDLLMHHGVLCECLHVQFD